VRRRILGVVAALSLSLLAAPIAAAAQPPTKVYEGPAQTLGIMLQPVKVRHPQDFDHAFAQLASARVDALFVVTSPLTNTHANQIVQLVARTRLPAIYGQKRYVEAGGLMSYTAHLLEQFRRAAVYVDRILKGAKPADLPIEQPTKFELVVNLKAASALGMTIPPSVLGRADQVIK